MRWLTLLLIRHSILPCRRWFYRLVMTHAWKPIDPLDIDSGIDGYINLGFNATPETVRNFRIWWDTCRKSLETAGNGR